MSAHPRAAELARLIRAVKAAGMNVSAVEVRWEEIEGRSVPTWRIVTAGDAAKRIGETVEW